MSSETNSNRDYRDKVQSILRVTGGPDFPTARGTSTPYRPDEVASLMGAFNEISDQLFRDEDPIVEHDVEAHQSEFGTRETKLGARALKASQQPEI